VALALLMVPGSGAARDAASFAARGGLDIASAAAQAWAADGYLVYVENDETIDEQGASPRWGYLFYSPSMNRSRAYSVREGRIVTAEYLDMKFEAPALQTNWMDSGQALEVAEKGAGRAFKKQYGGTLATMLLMRGAFQDENPDQATWTMVYTAPHAPALFVMVDAVAGKVRRTWRG
jgi:hypothetical protein